MMQVSKFIARAIIGALFALLCFVQYAFCQSSDMAKVILNAVNESPELKGDFSEIDSAKADLKISNSSLLPTISVISNFNETGIGRTSEVNNFINRGSQLEVGATLTQPIFQGFALKNRKAQKSIQLEIATARYELKKQEFIFALIEAYIEVVRTNEVFDLNVRRLDTLREQENTITDRLTYGNITKSDVSLAHSRVLSAEASTERARVNKNTATQNFQALSGRVSDNMRIPPLPTLPDSLNDALQNMKASNLNLLMTKLDVAASEFEVAIAKSEYSPKIDLNVSRTESLIGGDSFNFNDGLSARISLSVPLYNGGFSSATVNKAKASMSNTKFSEIQTTMMVEAQVRAAWETLSGAKKLNVLATSRLTASRDAYEGFKLEAEVGNRTVIDVLNIEQELLEAEVELITAGANQILGAYNLLLSVGALNEMVVR